MKRIPSVYWKANYEAVPDYYQQAWVQRWLELTDPNTSFLYSPPIVNMAVILDEIVNHKRLGARDYYFLLGQLSESVKTDPACSQICTENCIDLINFLDPLLAEGSRLFDKHGCKKSGVTKKADIDPFEASIQSSLSMFDNLLKLLRGGNKYRQVLCEKLKDALTESICSFEEIDLISGYLMTELVVNGNFSLSFLSEHCVKMFLREKNRESFTQRLNGFLHRFQQSQSWFNVYLRVQVSRRVRSISHIGEIVFKDRIPEIIPYIETISERDGWSSSQEKQVKSFFFHGGEAENLLFAIAENIPAEDAANAATRALNALVIAIQQAKFEYELRGFSIDKRVYARNLTHNKMEAISVKALRQAQQGAYGDPTRLERLINRLSSINYEYYLATSNTHGENKKRLADKITKTALAWYRNAAETDSVAVQFLNDWIGIEQIFEVVETVSCKESAADKAVLALSNYLTIFSSQQRVLDLLGDIHRVDGFGTPRIVAPWQGRVEYSEELLELPKVKHLRYVPQNFHTHPELILRRKGGKQVFKLRPGSIILITDASEVAEGQWLAGAFLNRDLAPIMCNSVEFFSLYSDRIPTVENLLYICYYNYQVRSLANERAWLTGDSFTSFDFPKEATEFKSLTSAMRLYDRLEYLLNDISRFEGGSPGELLNKLLNNKFVTYSNRGLSEIYSDFVENVILPGTHISAFGGKYAKRLQLTRAETEILKRYLQEYKYLRREGSSLLAQIEKKPVNVLCEAYRNQLPHINPDHLSHSILSNFSCDQPLLMERIKKQSRDSLNGTSSKNWIAEIDQLRRVRNELAHNAHARANLELIAPLLHKYTRAYLRNIIYRLANYHESRKSVESLIFVFSGPQ
jgi:hypothetical protein